MTYPEARRPFDAPPRYVGEGFRVEPDFRQETGEPEYVPPDFEPPAQRTLPAGPSTPALPPGRSVPMALTAAELDDVFDDPSQGERGRDRFGVHAMWELLLVLAVAAMALATYAHSGNLLSPTNLRALMLVASITGLLALGAGLSLRAGAVNLALGPIMVMSGIWFVKLRPDGLWTAVGASLGIAAGIGVVIALVVTALHVPGWVASLVAILGLRVWMGHLPQSQDLGFSYHLDGKAYSIFGIFAVLAVGGAGLGAIHTIRRWIGRYRPVSDPADWRGTGAAVTAGLAIVASSLLAGVAGLGAAMQAGQFVASDGFLPSATAVALALLAGTSAYGRRGGVFGTLLAVTLYTLTAYYATAADWKVDPYALIGGALLLGLGASRLIESYGRPRRTAEDIDESTSRWLGRDGSGWADQAPTRTHELPAAGALPGGGATWVDRDDDPWGGR
jgi:ribose/xylose/arabinose/galactoside ABC-type transport system permease subunit